MTAYIARSAYRPNRKDNPNGVSRSRRKVHKPWLDAGFEVADWNKYKLVVKNRTYHIAPGGGGMRVTGRTIVEYDDIPGLVFPYGTAPATIAMYLSNLADNPRQSDTNE